MTGIWVCLCDWDMGVSVLSGMWVYFVFFFEDAWVCGWCLCSASPCRLPQ